MNSIQTLTSICFVRGTQQLPNSVPSSLWQICEPGPPSGRRVRGRCLGGQKCRHAHARVCMHMRRVRGVRTV